MSTIRPFEPTDLFKFNHVNVDPWTATYHNGYYSSYFAQWSDFSVAVEGAFDKSIKAYSGLRWIKSLKVVIGKHEPPAPDPQQHGHLTALSISPEYREMGLARTLMDLLEQLSGNGKDGADTWFVDLFVRCNNVRATEMYEKLGYSVYRRVVDYYHGMEGVGSTRDELDGFDMRKSMPRDTARKYIRENGRNILVTPEQVWA